MILKKIYRQIRAFIELRVLGTRFAELVWRTRHWYKTNWASEYIRSTGHPHRNQILREIEEFESFHSVLEVGCGAGPNLLLLSKKYPEKIMYGIDINPNGVKTLSRYIRENRINNIQCQVGKADYLSAFADNSVDIVFTDAVLMFIGNDKINTVLQELFRVARKGVILNEFYSASPPDRNYEGGRYVHNYVKLIQIMSPGSQISIKKSIFTGGQWDKYGSLIRVFYETGK